MSALKDKKGFAKFIPAELRKKYGSAPGVYEKKAWSSFGIEERRSIVLHNLQSLIGPAEVLRDLGSGQTYDEKIISIEKFAEEKAGDASAYGRLRWIVVGTMLQSEFLRY